MGNNIAKALLGAFIIMVIVGVVVGMALFYLYATTPTGIGL